MRILWLSNFPFSSKDLSNTGTWVQPLAEALVTNHNIQIGNVSWGNNPCHEIINGIEQWIITPKRLSRYGHEAPTRICLQVLNIIEEFKPDLVHIWGTESAWASIVRKGYIKTNTLLEIQGLLYPYYHYYLGSLSIKDIIDCVHLKEILMPWRNLLGKQHVFKKRGIEEKRNLKAFRNIATQSNWSRYYVSTCVPQAELFTSKIMLRPAFYNANWNYHLDVSHPIIFSTFSGAIPYKGMHILLETVSILKEKYPHIELRIAGTFYIGNKLIDGYSLFLRYLIKKYQLEQNIVLLGNIDATTIVKELENADVCVIPSFVETYCLAFAEAMIVGCPVVCAYSGAMPELALDKEDVLFYNPADAYMSARMIEYTFDNPDKTILRSQNARTKRLKENMPIDVINNQIEIYSKIINE